MRAPKKLDAQALFEYALRLLSGRAQSSGEVREKLRRKAEKLTDIDGVLSRLKEYGFLDDRRFAEHFAQWRRENQGFGSARVLRDLRVRRVAPAVADGAVKNAFAGTDELKAIEEYLRKKMRNVPLARHLSDPKKLAAAYRKLRYAGFSSSNSIRVLKRYAAQADALEELEDGDELSLQPPPD